MCYHAHLRTRLLSHRKSPPPPPSPSSASNQAASNSQGLPALYVKRTIRGGQTVEYPGTVVVYGNVNRQSAILAGGDIVVWGRLNGEAHAGKDGDRDCQIMAMEMHPSTIRIADRVAYGPEGKELYPEVARIGAGGTISIVPAGMYASSVEERIGMAARLSGKGASLNQMSRAGKSAAFTGAYIFLVGLALLVAPLTVFGLLFDVRTITGGWIRVGGVLCMVFGMQYLGTALGDAAGIGAQAFYTASVVSRMVLFILFAVLVAVREVQATLLLLAAVNLAGALLMFANLRSDEQAGRSSVLSLVAVAALHLLATSLTASNVDAMQLVATMLLSTGRRMRHRPCVPVGDAIRGMTYGPLSLATVDSTSWSCAVPHRCGRAYGEMVATSLGDLVGRDAILGGRQLLR
eukprot:jgi/Mesvir1/4891/Mv11158-RA.1